MITWLPYPNYALSAHVLGPRDIGKQRLEGLNILRILAGRGGGMWKYHPATKMWVGHERSLMQYTACCIREWVRRGGQDNMMAPDDRAGLRQWGLPDHWADLELRHPHWLGHGRLHATHRAALLKKDYHWYGRMAWEEPHVRDIFFPSPLPGPGEYVIAPDQVVWLVTEVTPDYTRIMREGDTSSSTEVHNRLIQTRVWVAAMRG